MADHSIEALLVRVADLEHRLEASKAAPMPRPSKRRRTALVAGLLAVALLVPVGVFASHTFTDVPDSNTFHTQIGRLAGAAITSGCTATTYCPNANVTRGQMAAFIARSAGRVSTDNWVTFPLTASPTEIGEVVIKAGDVTGGYARILVEATVSATHSSLTGCPCGSVFYLLDDGGSQIGWPAYSSETVANAFGGSVGSVALSAVVVVPTGVAQTFTLSGFETLGTTATTNLFGTMSATYIPFTGDGSNPIIVRDPAGPDDRMLYPGG